MRVAAGSLAGYRKMWHILRIKHHLHVPRKLVATILRELDPEASDMRREKKLRRRQYLSQGPNQCWHIDGMHQNHKVQFQGPKVAFFAVVPG
jgi:transposase InsO family protein